MSKPETMMIDDVKYVRADAVQPGTKGDVKIVIVDRGFVYVGRVWSDPDPETTPRRDKDTLILRNAKNIRIWGTTKGIGELVNGPTKETVLDVIGTVRIPMRAVISIIDVVESKWTGI